ncbi:MAG: CoB--CoM heterodisulfide reductase iron-sulfur subunit B family protein [Clostridia bacterium]|nr:CoB--CoM heterodisulfide reductase iron-sulfur subunit B family protein [Clostridia bacterium]
MEFCYFPGCTLKNKAKDLDRYARLCAEILGVKLTELPEWQCCGGVYVSPSDDVAVKLASVRALIAAEERGLPLLTVCSACHNVLKRTEYDLRTNAEFAAKVKAYAGSVYKGTVKVVHYLEMLRDDVGYEKIRAAVKRPLDGMKIGCYYGCMLLRPGRIMRTDNPEDPVIMEELIKALGGEPVAFPERNECCGAYTYAESETLTEKRSERVAKSAENCGAELLATACPLCKYNVGKYGDLPVLYFTELTAKAFGVK